MNLSQIQTLARRHLGAGAMESSARLRLADSIACEDRDDWAGAARAALDSLRFSVGIMHPDFVRAAKGVQS